LTTKEEYIERNSEEKGRNGREGEVEEKRSEVQVEDWWTRVEQLKGL
jgi:hypothetical protein